MTGLSQPVLVMIALLVGGLATALARLALRRAQGVMRTLLATGSGGGAGLAAGLLLACAVSPTLGMVPGSPENLWFFCLALGFLGIVLGSLAGIVWIQRMGR